MLSLAILTVGQYGLALLPVSLPVVPRARPDHEVSLKKRLEPLVGLGGAVWYYALPRSCEVAGRGVDEWRGRGAASRCFRARTNSGRGSRMAAGLPGAHGEVAKEGTLAGGAGAGHVV